MASIECAVYNSDRIAVSELAKSCLKSQFWKQRNIKKTSVTFEKDYREYATMIYKI